MPGDSSLQHVPVQPHESPQHVRFHIDAVELQGTRSEEAADAGARHAAVHTTHAPPPASQLTAAEPDALATAPLLLSFRGMCVSSASPARYLLRNVSGSVRAGGLTALVGASGSGKTLLLQLLSGRLAGSSLSSRGSVRVAGRAVSLNGDGGSSEHGPPARIGFVAQEDHLIGEITVRETFRFAAQLRLPHSVSHEQREKEISDLIDGLGLTHVADNVIGTVLRRGLSGGEKRRVSVGVELAARPTVICLDGSTDGLDASSAYEVLRSVQRLARNSNGQLCVLASIHQPNSRLLHLFDDMLVLGRGGSVYFGPVREASGYFSSIGFPPPQHQTITDYVLHIVDTRFRSVATRPQAGANKPGHKNDAKRNGGTQLQLVAERKSTALASAAVEEDDADRAADVDFPLQFELSAEAARMHARFQAEDHAAAQCGIGIHHDSASHSRYLTTWLEQFAVLTDRFAMVARRDLTLYILQFVLCAGFGFMVGAEFWQLPRIIGTRLQDVTNGIVWLVFVSSYLQVFKVYYLMSNKRRFLDEHFNQSFAVSAWSAADLLVTAVCSFITFIPGLVIGWFMMGLPAESIGYGILMLFLTALASESLMDLVCQLFVAIPTAILVGQGVLVVLCVFAGGAFIEWSRLGFWIWLSECSLYTWATRGLMLHTARHISYECPAAQVAGSSCMFNGLAFPIDADTGRVSGATVMAVNKDLHHDDVWYQFGILLLLTGLFRIATYVLLRFPLDQMIASVRKLGANSLTETVLAQEDSLVTLQARVKLLEQTTGARADTVQVDPIGAAVVASSPPDVLVSMPSVRTFTSRGCALHWKNLSLTLRSNGATLVEDLDGEATPGRMLAIMGPSGAGKTTMLNALAGRAPYARIHGSVLLGSSPLSKNHLDFVPQFDALNPAHTVYDTLCIMAKLKNLNSAECAPRVSELLDMLGLVPLAHKFVGELSSGDRKRVSIGLALIANPSVLFLDEPTTGLDSESAFVVCQYLLRVTRSTGVVCVLTIHQPSAAIFALCDDLLLLSKGRMSYLGRAAEAEGYFASQGFHLPDSTNPADFVLDLMNAKDSKAIARVTKPPQAADEGEQKESEAEVAAPPPAWRTMFDASPQRYVARTTGRTPAPEPERPSELSRLSVLTRSRLLYFINERSLYLYRLLELLLLAIFIGTLFLRVPHTLVRLQETSGAMFFSVWVTLFAAISATPVFVRDRLVCDNEYLNGAYSLWVHVLAQLMAGAPFQLASAITFQTIVWFMVGFNDSFEPWLFATLMTFALLLLMEGVSLLLVHFVPSAMLATTGSMVCLGMLFLFNGFFVRVADSVASIAWLAWIMPTKYTLDGMLTNILRGQQYDTGAGSWMQGTDVATDFFKLDSRPKWGDWAIVMSYAIAMRIAHWAALKFSYRHTQKDTLQEAPAK